nr:hypothetical protein [Tanacetum cinerariifolium]
MDSNFNNENDSWEYSLDIDDYGPHLTTVLRLSSSTHVEPYPSTPNPVRIIPGHAGIIQLSSSTRVEPSPSTPNPVRIIPGPAVVEDVDKDVNFRSGPWISATEYVNANGGTVIGCLGDIDNNLKKGKLDKVVAIVKSCPPNDYGDLTVTMKDPSGAVMLLANVLVFSPKPSMHYLNITKKMWLRFPQGCGSWEWQWLRQTILLKGATLKDDFDWSKFGVKEGQKLMMMGTADEIVKVPEKGPVFMEDLSKEEQVAAVMRITGEEKSYENLCKTFDHEAKAVRKAPKVYKCNARSTQRDLARKMFASMMASGTIRAIEVAAHTCTQPSLAFVTFRGTYSSRISTSNGQCKCPYYFFIESLDVVG